MYISQQRKKLKTCLSFQRHNTKIRKHNLRRFKFHKQIHTLYALLSHILPISYNRATVQEHIVQAILATPPQAQISCNQPETRINPFPDHIFPQLRSLKRSKQKAKRANQMEPIHWESGLRSNRPFEKVFQDNNFTPTRRRSQPPPRQAARQRQIPTQYYLEQAPFYAENFGPDPFATEPEVIIPGPVKAVVLSFLKTLSEISIPSLDILAAFISSLFALGHFAGFRATWSLVKFIYEVIGSLEWEVLTAMAIANQIVRLLPGMRGDVLTDSGEVDGLVYTIFIKGGQAIGTGAVMTEMC